MNLYPNDRTDLEDLAAWTEWHLRDRFPGRRFAPGQYHADALELEPLDTAVWHVGAKPTPLPGTASGRPGIQDIPVHQEASHV